MCKLLVKKFLSIRVLLQLFCLCEFISEAKNFSYVADSMAPVILVPGIGQSQIEGKWDHRFPPGKCERKEDDWKVLWLDFSVPLDPNALKCWAYRFSLRYSSIFKDYYNQEGVTTRVPREFGSVEPSEFMTRDALTKQKTGYFNALIEEFEKLGYRRGVTIFGASYDWRYAPQKLQKLGYYRELAALIEKTAAATQRKVAIVTHSMGGLVASFFLHNQPKAWKDRYINSFTAVSTPWLGSVYGLELFLTGSDFASIKVDKLETRRVTRTFQSSAFLLPDEGTYDKTVLVQWVTGRKNYTAADYKRLFRTIGYDTACLMREDVQSYYPVALEKIGTPMTCIHSTVPGDKTLARYIVNGSLADPNAYQQQNGEGDGLVLLNSLQYCDKFKNVNVRQLQGIPHEETIKNPIAIEHIISSCKNAAPFH